jgi:hypothetical protein
MMTDIVAERVLRHATAGTDVVARIFAPVPIDETSEWSCKIEIQGLERPYEKPIIGVDSFQAMVLALKLLCTYLEKHEAELAFLDGAPGDIGLPLIASCCVPETKTEAYCFICEKDRELLTSPSPDTPSPDVRGHLPDMPDEIVAARVLRDVTTDTDVVACIFVPNRIGPSTWTCGIDIQGLGRPYETSVSGVDSFQALYLGLRAICVHLEKYESNLIFPQDGLPGDAGLPFISFCPPESKPEAHRFVEEKIVAHLRSQRPHEG